MILWIMFYILTLILIILFFVNEKYITRNLNNWADNISGMLPENLSLNIKNIRVINFINAFVILLIYIFLIDKKPNSIIPIEKYALNLTMVLNIALIVFNYYKAQVFILDLVMLLAGKSVFGISDKWFTTSMVIALIFLILTMLLEREEIKKRLRIVFNGIFLIFLISIIQLFYLGNYVIPTQSMEPTILVQDRIFSNNIVYKFKKPQLNDIISFKEPLDNDVMYTKRITGVAGTVFNIVDSRVLSDDKKISDRTYSYGRGSVYNLYKQPIYIPKKGDMVTIDKVLRYDLVNGRIDEITPKQFLDEASALDYSKIFGIFNNYDGKIRYTYIMKAEGHDQIMLPILDFKYSKSKMDKMLNGGYIKLHDNYYMAMGDNTDNSQDSRYFGYVKESRIKGRLFLRWFPLNRIGFIRDEKF